MNELKIIDYYAKRSSRDQYHGNLWVKTDKGEFEICFDATNFCLHSGKFFNIDSTPISSSTEFRKIALRPSLNGSPVSSEIMSGIEKALEEAVIAL